MKALASAEKEKKGKAQAPAAKTDNISPFPQPTKNQPHTAAHHAATPPHLNLPQQQAAANMFSAAQLPASSFTHILWALALVAGALAIWLSLQIFQTNTSATQLLVAQNPLPSNTQTPQPLARTVESVTNTPSNPLQNRPSPSAGTHRIPLFEKISEAQSRPVIDQSPVDQNPSVSQAKPSEPLLTASTSHAEQNALQLSLKKATSVVDPTLLSAYQAFNQGELSQAQQLYRQVLQKDIRNVDALLGMAAIAQRQSRHADAVGWYQKVLEIEPSHPLAQAAIVEMQPAIDSVSQISRLKSLIAQQPETASLYAALGNAHAEQNHWQEAQAAYFEAVRFAPQSADYIFNLAISLEHLNQPQLALLQYQRALQRIEVTGTTNPDPQLIKNRILALQPTP